MDLEMPMASVAGAKCSLREQCKTAGAGWRDWRATEGFE